MEDGVLTIKGDLKIVSVDPALDSATAMLLAGLAVDMLPEPVVDMLPEPTEPELTPAEQLTAAQDAVTAAQMAVDSAQTPADISAAYGQLAMAQAALAAAQSIPENQMAAMQTETINGLIATANAAVSGVDQLTSSGTEVQAARAALAAVTDAIAAAMALDAAEKAALGAMISMADSDLMVIENYQVSPVGMLGIAERAVERAQMTVDGLPPSTTPADIAVANSALAQAQAHLAVVSTNPAVMQILAQRRLDHLETVAEKRAVLSEALEAAQMTVDALTDASTDEDVSDARVKVDMALAALEASGLSEADSDGLSQSIAALDTTVGGIETARAEAAEEAYKTALAGVTSEIATAKTLADALTDESSAADVTAANNKVSAAQTALDDAGLNDADTTTQQAAITALTTTISDGEADRTAHRTMVAEAKVESDSDAANTKTTAIKAEAGETGEADAGLGGTDTSAIVEGVRSEGAYGLSIERDRMATTVTITVQGATEDDDVEFHAGCGPGARPHHAHSCDGRG